jgi:acetylornithine deacetylase
VHRDEAWGLVGRLPGTGSGDGPTLMFDGHVDVVPVGDPAAWSTPDPFSGRVVAGELHGRGSCDMKAGLVAAIAAVAAVRRSGAPLRGDLLLACVAGEEDGGLGTFATLHRGWTADACVVPEPTGLDLVTANAGALTFRLRVPGLATHASRRTEGVSAVEKLVPLLTALQRLEADRNREVDPLMARWAMAYPLSIGRVRAGDWASSVPDLLVAEGRLGVALDEPVADARAALELAVAEASAADPWLRDHPATVEWWGGQFASGRLAADSDLADRVAAAHDAGTGGGTPDRWGAPYGSDLRLLAGAGVPTLHYGPGDAVLAHAPDERVPLADVHTTTRTLALLALDLCGIA